MLYSGLQFSLNENTWIPVKSYYFCLSRFSQHILLKKDIVKEGFWEAGYWKKIR